MDKVVATSWSIFNRRLRSDRRKYVLPKECAARNYIYDSLISLVVVLNASIEIPTNVELVQLIFDLERHARDRNLHIKFFFIDSIEQRICSIE